MKKTMRDPLCRVCAALLAVLLFALLCVPSRALLPDNERLPGYTMSSSYKSGKYYQQLLAVKLTGDMRKDIISVARSQVGYHEGDSTSTMSGSSSSSSNYTEYNRFYTVYANSKGDSYNYINCAWCGSFVAFCMYMARVPENVLRLSAQTNPSAWGITGSSKKAGAQYKSFYDLSIKGGNYTPLPGDIVFFAHSSGSDSYRHIGIVESVTIGRNDAGQKTLTINTFEGNCTDQVKNSHWTFTSDSSGRCYSGMYITGFGIPKYTTQVVSEPVDTDPPDTDPHLVEGGFDLGEYGGTLLKSGSTGEKVMRLQLGLNIVAWGSSVSSSCGVTGVFDDETLKAVKAYQTARSLEVDGIVGNATFSVLRSEVNRMVNGVSSDYVVNGVGKLLLYKGKSASAIIPDVCTSIGGYAFCDASVTSVTLPDSVTTVYANAFYGVTSLASVTVPNPDVISVFEEGNSAFLAALSSIQDQPTPSFLAEYAVTFDVGGVKSVITLTEGTVPTFTGSTERVSDEYIYFFIGWDKPFAPVTGAVTYKALYYKVRNVDVHLTSPALTVRQNDCFSCIINAEELQNVTSFSFDVDCTQYGDQISLLDTTPTPDGVTIDASSIPGIIRISYEGPALSGRAEIASLKFRLSDKVLTDQICLPISTGTNGGFFSACNGASYALPVATDCIVVNVDRLAYFDVDASGTLTIDDVTLALDNLGGTGTHSGIGAAASIEFVTRLLDVIAAQ